jgi:hypothetical protein
MAFENITKINIIGTPELPIPAGMTVETVLTAMGYKLEDYEQRVEGTTLVLSATAGTKGILEVRAVNGKVLPKGGTTFPTDKDIEIISRLFPEDDLFTTLDSPSKLQEYLTAIEEKAEQLILEAVAAKEAESQTDAEASVDELKATLARVEAYATKVGNPIQPNIIAQVVSANENLSNLLKLAEECEVQATIKEREVSERERILEEIRNREA